MIQRVPELDAHILELAARLEQQRREIAELLDALDDVPELDERELQDLDLNDCNDWETPS